MNDGSNRNSRRVWILLAGVLVGWLVVETWLRPGPRGPQLDMNVQGQASLDWTVQDPAGAPVSLAQYKGRPIVLNIWATWCGPCVQELPSLDRLAANQEITERGIVVLAITQDDTETLQRFLAGRSIQSLQVLRSDEIPAAFASQYIPATYIIDAQGQIVESTIGGADWDTPEVVNFLKELAGPVAVAAGNEPA